MWEKDGGGDLQILLKGFPLAMGGGGTFECVIGWVAVICSRFTGSVCVGGRRMGGGTSRCCSEGIPQAMGGGDTSECVMGVCEWDGRGDLQMLLRGDPSGGGRRGHLRVCGGSV